MDCNTFDRLVEEWHNVYTVLSIWDYMGISREEYNRHVELKLINHKVYYIKTKKLTKSESETHLKEQIEQLNRPFSISGNTQPS